MSIRKVRILQFQQVNIPVFKAISKHKSVIFPVFFCKLRRNSLYRSEPYLRMAHRFPLLRSSSSPGSQRLMNPRGVMVSFGLRLCACVCVGGGEGGGGAGV